MKHFNVTNLLSEHEIGDLNFSPFQSRLGSLCYRLGIQIQKIIKSLEKQKKDLKFYG